MRFLRHSIVVVLLALAAMLSLGRDAWAQPTDITINITAEVAQVDDPDNILGGAINVGDTITGTYTYDFTTSDSEPDPTVGNYWHSSLPYGITVNAGGFVFETDPSNVSFLVDIGNDQGAPTRDVYLLRSYNNLPLSNGALVEHISWQLNDPTATALSSDALPTVPPTLADWQSIFGLSLQGSDPGFAFLPYFITAHVTSADFVTPAVGGLAGFPDVGEPAPGTAESSEGSSSLTYAALAGGAILAFVAGGWYARRRLA